VTHRVAATTAAALTIKRFLRPESDVENNIIYFEYLLGTSYPSQGLFHRALVDILLLLLLYLRHCNVLAPRQTHRTRFSSDRTEPKYSSSVKGRGGEGFRRTFIVYHIYIYIVDHERGARDLYILYDCGTMFQIPSRSCIFLFTFNF